MGPDGSAGAAANGPKPGEFVEVAAEAAEIPIRLDV